MAEFRRPRRRPGGPLVGLVVATAVLALAGACGGHSGNPTNPTPVPGNGSLADPTSPAPPGSFGRLPVVLVGAGDIALCGPDLANATATSKLIDAIDGAVFTAGDNTQALGTNDEFLNCYGPTWGRFRARTRPAPGNHDYMTDNGAPYYNYFGAAAGPRDLGYYSYDLGAWHIVALNSNISMKAGSPQIEWLRSDLASSDRPCTAAYWHHPLFSSGPNGNTAAVRDAWSVLYQYGVEIVMNGHDHMFERFAPQDPMGRPDPAGGIRQFTVGTGGCFLYKPVRFQANSEVQASVHGVLKLILRGDGYDWEFVGVPGARFSDAGSAACH
jgi:3',5'-cyclic AMP phosphodiesterase CpdA